MAIDQRRPLQFNLRSVFGLTAAVGLLSWLVSGGSRDAPLFLPCYLFVGLAQLVLARIVWKRWSQRDWRNDLHCQAHQTALVACGMTLVPWAILVIGLVSWRLHAFEVLPEAVLGVLLATAMLAAPMLHVLGGIANLINFILDPGSLRDGPLLALMLLTATNTAVPILFLWWALAAL